MKSSHGTFVSILSDYLGRDNVRLFAHELEAWLRNDCERLSEWDERVQYRMPMSDYADGARRGWRIVNGRDEEVASFVEEDYG